jgi:hypothetical protein
MKDEPSEAYHHSRSQKYTKRKPRRDPVGGEDSDINNDGKVDLTDKYQQAKRDLYKKYMAAKQSKSKDLQVPNVKMENSMIKLSGLVNFEVLKEEEWIQKAIKRPGALHKELGVPEGETIPVEKLQSAAEKGGQLGKQARLALTLRKLKESDKLTEEQYTKVCDMEEKLIGGQKKLDADGDGKLTGKDFAMLRGAKPVTEFRNDDDDYDARRDAWAEFSDEPYRSPYDRGTKSVSKPSTPKTSTTPVASKDSMMQQKVKYKDADGKEHEATVKSLLGYSKDHPGRKAAARVYAKHMSGQKKEGIVAESQYEMEPTNDDHEGRMAKSDLLALHKQAGELYNMLGDNEELEGWVQSKITLAADYISAVYNNLQYEKNKPLSIGTGMGAPADSQTTPTPPKPPMAESVTMEVAPEGWEKTIKTMKRHKEIDNPWALANWMKKKGYTPTKETSSGEIDEARKTAAQRFSSRKGISNVIKNLQKAVDKNKKASDDAMVKNPETGKDILATTAAKDKDHPAHDAAKSALKK